MKSGAAAAILVAVVALAGCAGSGKASVAAPLPPELTDLLTTEVDCAGAPLVQVRQHRYDFTGDGIDDALVAVRCDAGAGAPPSAVFAIAARPNAPEVVDELLRPEDGEVVKDLQAVGPNAVVTTFGFSPKAPRCCPDLQISHTYRWDGFAFADGTAQSTPLPEAPSGESADDPA